MPNDQGVPAALAKPLTSVALSVADAYSVGGKIIIGQHLLLAEPQGRARSSTAGRCFGYLDRPDQECVSAGDPYIGWRKPAEASQA